MPNTPEGPEAIVTLNLLEETRNVISQVRNSIQWADMLDAKLGGPNNAPTPDKAIAEVHGIQLNAVRIRLSRIIDVLSETDQQCGHPLADTAQRANAIMDRAAIVNLHHRRPALYSEATLEAFIKLGVATPQHLPIIRAAGYVSSPSVVPRSHGIDAVIADVAAHMARSHEPQSPALILQSIRHRNDRLAHWPQLDLALFTHRVADILPDEHGLYHPDQAWGNHISAKKLVANTLVRILTRDQRPHTMAHLIEETRRLVGHFLPLHYNIGEAVRASASESDEISWQGLSTFGLKLWDTSLEPHEMLTRRGRTGDLIYSFLMQHGPAKMRDIIAHVQRLTTNTKRRTIQDAVNYDPANRFLKLEDSRVGANPIPHDHNPDSGRLVIVPDDTDHRPAPVLRESELKWLTHYVRGLNGLDPPLPLRVVLSGHRANGFALEGAMVVTVVVEAHDRPSMDHRLAEIDATASARVPDLRTDIRVVSSPEWERQQRSHNPDHSVWLHT